MRPLIAAALALGLVTPAAHADDKPADKARDSAVGFLKAVKAKDVGAVMKMCSVPFVYRDGDKPAVLKDEAALRAWVKERLDDIPDADKVPTTVARVVPFAELKDKIKDAADRKLVEDTVGADGFVAFVELPGGGEIPILVRVSGSSAKVVGLVTK